MEEEQTDQEDSAIERETGNPSQGLPARSPDVVNLENVSLAVDDDASEWVLESSPKYPKNLNEAIGLDKAINSKDFKVSKLTNEELRSNSKKNKARRKVSTNGDLDPGISMQGEASNFVVGSLPAEEGAVGMWASSSQHFDFPAGRNVTGCKKSEDETKVKCYARGNRSEGASVKNVGSGKKTTERIAPSTSQDQRVLEGFILHENPDVRGRQELTLSANRLRSGLNDPEPADHVEIMFPRTGSSISAAGSARITADSYSRKRGESLWGIVTEGLCCGFMICNWFPKMCSCLDGAAPMHGNCSSASNGSYERLGSGPTLFDFSSMIQRARRRAANRGEELIDNERQAELTFYNDDLTWIRVCVERNLRTMDLCELLKVKRNASGAAWSIVETWPELGIERTLEDHEDILATHREMEMFASHHERKFYFRKDYLKYEFFISPKQFFPSEMVAFPNDEDRGSSGDVEETLRSYLQRNDSECPQVFSLVWMRDESSSTWKKTYMLLQGRKLYTTKKAFFPGTKFLRSHLTSPKASQSSKTNSGHHRSLSPDHAMSPSTSPSSSTTSRSSDRSHHTNAGTLPKRPMDHEQPSPLAHLSDYYVYKIPNAKRYFNAPFEWGACLRPSSNAEAEDTEAGVPGLKVIAFTSEKSRACWLTAMRLAKYGKQLRENYRAFRNKQCEQNGGGSPKEQYSSYNVPNESLRSRVAMDFTGSVGRIVDDPKEAKDIAENEGIIWRRRWRPFSRPPPGCAMVRLHGLDGGIHVLQPWFHSGLNRDLAAAIIKEHGSVDGVFLVRESKSNPGAYVLTYKYSEKVFHAQIQPIFDERRNCWLYTLDKGVTKFYDLLQLIEFYQLNTGSLPTRLTHYVQNGVTVAPQRQEENGASPSPPFSGNQNMSPKSDCPKSSSGI